MTRRLTCLALAAAASPAVAQETTAPGLFTVSVGSGPITVIVVHGGPGVRHNYLRPEWDRLADRARVLYYDQRGCGRSSRVGPFTWQQHVADLDALVKSAKEAGPVVLAGSSWGSALILLHAIRYPGQVRTLVLSGIPTHVVTPRPANLDSIIRARAPTGTFVVDPPLPDPTVEQDSVATATRPSNLSAVVAKRLGATCPRAIVETWRSLRSAPMPDSLSNIQARVLIVAGTSEPPEAAGAERLAQLLPSARLLRLEGAAHDPWLEQPDEFFAAVREFLGRD